MRTHFDPQPHQRGHAIGHYSAQIIFAAPNPPVGAPSLDKARLERVRIEFQPLDQISGQSVPQQVRLAVVVRAFA